MPGGGVDNSHTDGWGCGGETFEMEMANCTVGMSVPLSDRWQTSNDHRKKDSNPPKARSHNFDNSLEEQHEEFS